MAGKRRLALLGLAIETTQLQLGLAIASAGSLAQQLQADTPITLAIAVMTEQTPKAALRHDHAIQCRLFEQAPSQAFDASGMAQRPIVEQPQCHVHGQSTAGLN